MKKRDDVIDRRDGLIRAAYGILARKGFEGLRLREVAAKAGIDHSTLHHHFRTKRDLIAAVLDYATEQFRPPIKPDETEPSSLHEHLKFLAQMMVERPELHVVLREFDLHAARDVKIRAVIAKREQGWRDRLAIRIRRAVEEGGWPSRCEPVTSAEMIIALVKGASFNPRSAAKVLNLFESLAGRQSSPPKSKRTRA